MLQADRLSKLTNDLSNATKEFEKEIATQCYLECLAVEGGEGECALAIKRKYEI